MDELPTNLRLFDSLVLAMQVLVQWSEMIPVVFNVVLELEVLMLTSNLLEM